MYINHADLIILHQKRRHPPQAALETISAEGKQSRSERCKPLERICCWKYEAAQGECMHDCVCTCLLCVCVYDDDMVCVYTYIYIHTYTYIFEYLCVCIDMRVCVCMYVCIYMYKLPFANQLRSATRLWLGDAIIRKTKRGVSIYV